MKITYCGRLYTANSTCKICKKEFYCPPSRKLLGYGQFCSNRCKGRFKKGKKDPNLTYKIPKGTVPWNKNNGRIVTKCKHCKKTISVLISQGTIFCSKGCAYTHLRKDYNKLKYGAKHSRIKEKFGEPHKCEYCGDTKSSKFEWANISGNYNFSRRDWIRLCCKCHRRFDRGIENKIFINKSCKKE